MLHIPVHDAIPGIRALAVSCSDIGRLLRELARTPLRPPHGYKSRFDQVVGAAPG